MAPIWVSEPMGDARFLRTASTPAKKVVATAPIPQVITPNLPWGFEIWIFFFANCRPFSCSLKIAKGKLPYCAKRAKIAIPLGTWRYGEVCFSGFQITHCRRKNSEPFWGVSADRFGSELCRRVLG